MELLLAPEGDVVAEHAATLTNRIAAVLLLVLPGAGLVALAMQLEPKDADAKAPLIVVGLLLAALGALAVAQQNKVRAVLRADGVERWGLRGRLWALRWADMKELRYRVIKVRLYHVIPIATYVHVHLTDPEGKKRKLPVNLKGMDVLSERIAEQQTTARFAEARARIDAGEEVAFGKPIALDREKVSVRKLFGGRKSCPLAEVEKVSIDAGVLRIRQKGKTFAFASLHTGSIPNVFLLLRLLDSLLGQKPAALGQDRDFAGQATVG